MRYTPFVVLLLLCAGCASAPVTPALSSINGVLTDEAINTLPAAQKEKIKAALISAKSEIIQAEKRADLAEKKVAGAEQWATRGKTGAVIFAGVVLMLILVSVLRVVRKFTI